MSKINNIAIEEMNFLMTRCDCTGCKVADKEEYQLEDFETDEEYVGWMKEQPSCVVCNDTGLYADNIGYEDEKWEKCFCKTGFNF